MFQKKLRSLGGHNWFICVTFHPYGAGDTILNSRLTHVESTAPPAIGPRQ